MSTSSLSMSISNSGYESHPITEVPSFTPIFNDLSHLITQSEEKYQSAIENRQGKKAQEKIESGKRVFTDLTKKLLEELPKISDYIDALKDENSELRNSLNHEQEELKNFQDTAIKAVAILKENFKNFSSTEALNALSDLEKLCPSKILVLDEFSSNQSIQNDYVPETQIKPESERLKDTLENLQLDISNIYKSYTDPKQETTAKDLLEPLEEFKESYAQHVERVKRLEQTFLVPHDELALKWSEIKILKAFIEEHLETITQTLQLVEPIEEINRSTATIRSDLEKLKLLLKNHPGENLGERMNTLVGIAMRYNEVAPLVANLIEPVTKRIQDLEKLIEDNSENLTKEIEEIYIHENKLRKNIEGNLEDAKNKLLEERKELLNTFSLSWQLTTQDMGPAINTKFEKERTSLAFDIQRVKYAIEKNNGSLPVVAFWNSWAGTFSGGNSWKWEGEDVIVNPPFNVE